MQIGAMNHPGQRVEDELAWMIEMKLDFIDLTLEPPAAATWQVDPVALGARIREAGFGVVGHTAYYLPIGSSFRSLRAAAVDELKHCLDAFAKVGAKWVNVHPDGHAPFVDEPTVVSRNIESLGQLVEHAREVGVAVMIENVPGRFNTAAQLTPILEALPEVGLHLDLGHCNLGVEKNTADGLIERYGGRLAHVHFHDNRGGHADLHLALGMGWIDLPHYVHLLKTSGYDGPITLEVFAADRHFLAYSRDKLRQWWDAV